LGWAGGRLVGGQWEAFKTGAVQEAVKDEFDSDEDDNEW
jgi:hypothetical protein